MQSHALSENTLNSLSTLILKHHPRGELPARNESTKSFCDAILALDTILIGRQINPDHARAIARLVMRDLEASGTNARLMADVAVWIVSVEGVERNVAPEKHYRTITVHAKTRRVSIGRNQWRYDMLLTLAQIDQLCMLFNRSGVAPAKPRKNEYWVNTNAFAHNCNVNENITTFSVMAEAGLGDVEVLQ